MTLVQTEPKKLYYGEPIIISDMQGPCQDGFHIPTYDEVIALRTLGYNIGAWEQYGSGTNLYRYLKTFGSKRGYEPNEIQGTDAVWGPISTTMYRTSTFDGTNYYYWYCDEDYMSAAGSYSNNGFFIRPFKNNPVTPDSNWTVLYQGTGSAGIYHNSTLGLISIGNGTTWMTIADKNLGATTVYNYGDTFSQANCGNCYQRGNNYGFPYGSTISSTTTKVNASTYGPGNYYSSSVYVKGGSKTYWDTSKNQNLRGGVTQKTEEKGAVKAVYLGENKVRPSGPDKDYLCFTAEEANTAIIIAKQGSPTTVSLETSTDGRTWTDYTFGTQIAITNIGDKVYIRNKSETVTNFSTGSSNYYQIQRYSGKFSASGDVNFLLCKNSTDTIPGGYCFYNLFYNNKYLLSAPELPATTLNNHCYSYMFYGCTRLTTPPALPATSLGTYCYEYMFSGCSNLEKVPALPAITMKSYCYRYMFQNCSKIKFSSSKTGNYQTEYRIPTTGTGATATNWNTSMFSGTGGTYTSNPSINTTYYTSNTVV